MREVGLEVLGLFNFSRILFFWAWQYIHSSFHVLKYLTTDNCQPHKCRWGARWRADLEIGSDFLRSLDWSSSLCSEIIPTCVRRARQTCAICPLMMVLRHLNQGRDGGLHSNSSCFWSIELPFPQPCRWYCKCDHRSDPPKSGATPRPQPAPSRNPSERQRLLSHQAAAYYCDHLHRAVVTGTVHVDAGFGRLNPHGIESTVSIAHDLLHGKVSCQYRGWAPRSSSIVRQCAGNSQSASDFPSSIQTCGVALLQLCYS